MREFFCQSCFHRWKTTKEGAVRCQACGSRRTKRTGVVFQDDNPQDIRSPATSPSGVVAAPLSSKERNRVGFVSKDEAKKKAQKATAPKKARKPAKGHISQNAKRRSKIDDRDVVKTLQHGADEVGRHACVNCATKFDWNFTLKANLTVTCPKCHSIEVVAISPRASAIAVVSVAQLSQPLSRRQVKRIRFIRNHWKMRCELKEHIEGFEGYLTRIGLTSEVIEKTKEHLRATLEEVDRLQDERVAKYDKLREDKDD